MNLKYKGREVEVTETELEIGEGCYVMHAVWIDTGDDLTDDECMELSELHQGELYQEAYEWAASRAYDFFKDRD